MLFNSKNKRNVGEGRVEIRVNASKEDWNIIRDALVGKITIDFNKDCKIYTSRSRMYDNLIYFAGTEIEKEIIDKYIDDILEYMEGIERSRLA